MRPWVNHCPLWTFFHLRKEGLDEMSSGVSSRSNVLCCSSEAGLRAEGRIRAHLEVDGLWPAGLMPQITSYVGSELETEV